MESWPKRFAVEDNFETLGADALCMRRIEESPIAIRQSRRAIGARLQVQLFLSVEDGEQKTKLGHQREAIEGGNKKKGRSQPAQPSIP
jgi:hypothetical protein